MMDGAISCRMNWHTSQNRLNQEEIKLSGNIKVVSKASFMKLKPGHKQVLCAHVGEWQYQCAQHVYPKELTHLFNAALKGFRRWQSGCVMKKL